MQRALWCRWIVCVGALCVGYAWCAEPIDTDGPDFVESSEGVGKGRFQFEAHVVRERGTRAGHDRTIYSTPTLLRFGVSKTIEARVETDGGMRTTAGGETTVSGRADTALGLKWHSQDRAYDTYTPAIAWIIHFEMPSGTKEFRGEGVRPSLRSVITWDLPHDLALGVMPGFRYDTTAEGHRYLSGILGVVLNKRWSESFRTFIESASSQIARGRNGGVISYWDIGAAYLLSPDWQIGARAGVGANDNTPRSQLLFELAGRF